METKYKLSKFTLESLHPEVKANRGKVIDDFSLR